MMKVTWTNHHFIYPDFFSFSYILYYLKYQYPKVVFFP